MIEQSALDTIDERLIGASETARLLGISNQTLRMWAASNDPDIRARVPAPYHPAVVKSKVQWMLGDVRAWIRARKSPTISKE